MIKRLVPVVVGIFMVVGFAVVDATAKTYPDLYPYEYQYTVKSGDTLWSIVVDSIDDDVDINRVVYDVRVDNNIDNDPLVPGSVITLRSKTPR